MVLHDTVAKLYTKHAIAEAGYWLHSAGVAYVRDEDTAESGVTSTASVSAECLNMWPTARSNSGDEVLPPIAIEITQEDIDMVRPSWIRHERIRTGGAVRAIDVRLA